MGTNTDSHRTQLTDIARAIGAILAAPLALFAVVHSITAQPITSLIVALITAILMSVWVILSRWVSITQIITAWLALAVVVLAGFVIWPKTMMVEGFVRDAAGNPVSKEEVVCLDRHNQRYETQTDAEGYYQFTCVPTGKYKLRVRGNEIEAETKGFLVRVIQQNLTVSEILAIASPTRVATITPNTPTATPAAPTDTPSFPPTLTPGPTPTATLTNTPSPTPTVTPTMPKGLLDDFEGGSRNVWGGTWYHYDDSTRGGTSTVIREIITPGADGTGHAIRMRGQVTTDYQYGYIGIVTTLAADGSPYDIREYMAVSFQARGDGKVYRMRLESASVTDYNYPGYNFTAESGWQSIYVPFSELRQEAWGTQVPWTGTDIRILSFQTVGQPHETVWLEIDNIVFHK